MVELVVAIVILAFGLLGLAGTTMYVIREITAADITTERAAALQAGIEHVRAIPFDSLDGDTIEFGAYTLSWRVTSLGSMHARGVELVTRGPGTSGGVGGMANISGEVEDTFRFTVVRP